VGFLFKCLLPIKYFIKSFTGTQEKPVQPSPLYSIPDLYTAGGNVDNVASDYANFEGITQPITGPTTSGLKWPDAGNINNYDTGNMYEDKEIAESILGGEAYAQLVYNNDPVAQAIPGLLGNPNEYNLGRPTDSNYVPFEPFKSNVPDIFKPQTSPKYAQPGGIVLEGPLYEFGGGKVRIKQLGDTVFNDPSYATELLSTGETVNVNPITGTYTGTGLFQDRPPGRW